MQHRARSVIFVKALKLLTDYNIASLMLRMLKSKKTRTTKSLKRNQYKGLCEARASTLHTTDFHCFICENLLQRPVMTPIFRLDVSA